jgi:hypothetical protein
VVSPVRTGPATGFPQPTPSPTFTGSVTLTAEDNGATVHLRPGQRVTVVLAPDFEQWHPATASGSAVRLISAGGGYPGRHPARAVFLAVAPGTATLSAISDAACLHARLRCMIPQQVWQATLIVSAG